jgi:hypothetical protein
MKTSSYFIFFKSQNITIKRPIQLVRPDNSQNIGNISPGLGKISNVVDLNQLIGFKVYTLDLNHAINHKHIKKL